MATAKQVEANRLNAQKSTGPKTDEGKAASSLNALTHGLSGNDSEAPGLISLERKLFEGYLTEFRNEYQPNTLEQEKLVETLAIESARIDRCRDAGFGIEAKLSQRARGFWEQDRVRDAETTYAKLHRDPARWVQDLEGTSQGCLVMIDRWELLKACLIKQQVWSDEQRSNALDLLGIPVAMRDGENAVDPETDNIYRARIELCDNELERLNELHEDHLPGEEFERAQDEQGVFTMLSKPGALLARYEAAADRRYDKAMRKLIASGGKSRGSSPKSAVISMPMPIQADSPPEPIAAPTLIEAPLPQPQPLPQPIFNLPVVQPPAPAPSMDKPKRSNSKTGSKMNRRQRRAMAARQRQAG